MSEERKEQIKTVAAYGGGGAVIAALLMQITTAITDQGEATPVLVFERFQEIAATQGEKLDAINTQLGEMNLKIALNTKVRDEIEKLEDDLAEMRKQLSDALHDHDGSAGHEEMLRREAVLRHEVDTLTERVRELEKQDG